MSIDRKPLNKIKSLLRNYCDANRGRFPKIEWIQKWTGLKHYKVVEALRILEAEEFLSRNYNQYKLNPVSSSEVLTINERRKKLGFSKIKDNKKLSVPIQSRKNKSDILLLTIRIVMAIIGLISIGLSIHFTQLWFREFFNPFLSILLSLSLISFSVIAFEVTVIFWKKHQHGFVFLFSLMWGIILVFSMMSTLAAQFNQWNIKEKKGIDQEIQIINQELIFQDYNKEEQEILSRIADEKIELTVNQNLLKQFDTLEQRKEDWRFYWSTKRTVDESQIEINRLEELLKETRNKKRTFLVSNQKINVIEKEQILSFYIWIGQIINIESTYIRFWLFIAPAVAVDILAAVGIALALFLKK